MQIASEWQERYWIYKTSYDEAYSKSSPSNLLYWYTLDWATQKNLRSYEFIGTMADWTRAWTQDVRSYVRVRGLPYSLRGVIATAILIRQKMRN